MRDLELADSLRERMRSLYGIDAARVQFVRSPYRICPLGAHIDHQLGMVTAMAIDRGVLLAFAPSGSTAVRLSSTDYPGDVRFELVAIPPKSANDWGNYARGAAMALCQEHVLGQGIVGVIHGELAEMGLSSSASVGLAYLLALEASNGLDVTPEDNIRFDQRIENDYLGLNNGILDQAAILLSRQDHLTVIDCRAFAEQKGSAPVKRTCADALPTGVSLLPQSPSMPKFGILIAESGITKSIVSTDYNRRVAECIEAARILLAKAGRQGAPERLGMVSPEEYDAHRGSLTGAPAKRAAHFFGEMRRVRLGQEAYARGDLATFGRLMAESGRSSIINYQCGCDPLIDMYETLINIPAVHGARFSGAGFRGCCIALIDPHLTDEIMGEVAQRYAALHPELAARARYLLCHSDDGARLL